MLFRSEPSVDPEGAAVSYRYAWSVDGAAGGDSDTVSADLTTDGQVWVVTVTPSDGGQDGDPGTATVTIGNSPPTPPVLSIDPAEPQAEDTLTLVFDTEAADPDGDALTQTIAWYEGGSENTGMADSMTVDGRYVDGGETWTAVVTVTDGKHDPVSAEVSVTVENQVPEMTVPRISPTSPADADDLTVSARAVDPDGNDLTYTYTWYRDGVEATDVGNSDTVPASATTVGEEWSAMVAVSDGIDEVSDYADPVTIIPWEGIYWAETFTVTVSPDGTTSSGEWSSILETHGSSVGENDCDLLWQVDGTQDARVCPRCDYAFSAALTLDASSVNTTGSICLGWYSDAVAEFSYDTRSHYFSAYGTPTSGYYYYGMYMSAQGTGGYSYSYYGYTYANYYSVGTSTDSGGNVTIEASTERIQYY